MANAGTVTVDFAAEVAKFNAALKQVNDRVKTVESSFKSIQKVADVALRFFSVGIATAFIKSAAEAADALGKTADKLGIATERLAAFQLAANDAGVETSTLNKLLLDAQKRLGEADFGGGDTLKFLRQFGLNVNELQRLKPDELFLRYSDAIATLSNKSDQLAAANAFFGKSASEAFGIIQAGRPAIEQAIANVDKLGLALSRVDIKQIEDANDRLALLGKTSVSVGQQIALHLAPFITAIGDALLESGINAKSFGDTLGKIFSTGFVAFEVLRNGVLSAEAAFFGLAGAAAKFLEIDARIATLGFSNEISKSLGAAADVNFERAKAALDGIKSFAQISEQLIAILESSRAKAEQEIADQQARAAELGVDTGEVRLEKINANLQAEQALQQQHNDIMLQIQQQFQAASAKLTQQLDVDTFVRQQTQREQAAINTEKNILAIRQMAANAGIGLLQALAGKSKTAAIALIAIQKAQAIAQALMAGNVASIKAFEAYGPTPAGYAAAAAMRVYTGLTVAAIAAQGLVEARSVISNPGPGAALGSPANPIFTNNTATSPTGPTGAQQKPVTTINVFGWSEAAIRDLVKRLKDEIGDHDLMLIRQP